MEGAEFFVCLFFPNESDGVCGAGGAGGASGAGGGGGADGADGGFDLGIGGALNLGNEGADGIEGALKFGNGGGLDVGNDGGAMFGNEGADTGWAGNFGIGGAENLFAIGDFCGSELEFDDEF